MQVSQTTPDISIVIPTRDRWDVLAGTLETVRAQDLRGATAEVIVVDNGSRTAPPDLGPGVVSLYESVPGAAAARNAGIAAATSELVLFLGDDCRLASEHAVRAHIDAHADGDPRRAVVGGIRWDPAMELTPVMEWLMKTGKMVDASADTIYTGNASIRREALLWVAGFDERFRGYGWEDTDLGLRLGDHGVRIEKLPDALVLHHHVYDEAASLARMEAMGRGANLLERLHDHRRPLPGPAKSRLRMLVGPRLPGRRGEHLAAYARGYVSQPPLSDDPVLRGYARFATFGGSRPAVSVVVPFLGDRAAGEELLAALGSLELGSDDEVIVVDNSPGAPVLPGARVHAPLQKSSYHARNAGADAATGEWLLFIDADCRPRKTLIDDYFAERIEDDCGAIAGRVTGAADQDAFVARYARSRGHLSQAAHMRDVFMPYGITANLLVRRSAFGSVGGFYEGLRSGGDADICWRLQEVGWKLFYREPAEVVHAHRERFVSLARQTARYAAAEAWLERHRPGSRVSAPLVRRLPRAGAAALLRLGFRDRDGALFSLTDGLIALIEVVGRQFGNSAPQVVGDGDAFIADTFPDAEAVPVLVPESVAVIEAVRRPRRLDRSLARGLPVRYEEDEGAARRALVLAVDSVVGRRRVVAAREALRDPRSGITPSAALAGAAVAARRLGGRRLVAGRGAERRAAALEALRGRS